MKLCIALTLLVVVQVSCAAERFEFGDRAGSSIEQGECVENGYRHKTDTELGQMTTEQLFNEEVKERIYHGDGTSLDNSDSSHEEFWKALRKYLNLQSERPFPVFSSHIGAYDPKNNSQCSRTRFLTAAQELSGIDTRSWARAYPDGQLAIVALERAVEKMRAAGFAIENRPGNDLYDLSSHFLVMLKGTNLRDEQIRATLEARHKVEMTDEEYVAFSNFLTALDPKYPMWSDVGEHGPPVLLKDSNRFYEAFLSFKARRR